MALALIQADEMGRIINEKLQSIQVNTSVKVMPQPKVTDTLWLQGWTVNAGEERTFLELQGVGEVEEFLVKADGSDFALTILRDGKNVWEGSYSKYRNISQEIDNVKAFQNVEDEYVVHVDSVGFKEELRISIAAIGSADVTASRIFAKWNLQTGRVVNTG